MPTTPREKERRKIAAKEEKGPIIVETDGLEKGNPHSTNRGAIPVTAKDTFRMSAHLNSKVTGSMLGKIRMIPGREEDNKNRR